MLKRFRALGAGTLAVMAMLIATTAASAASFAPEPGTSYTVDTSALTLTGPGTNVIGSDQGGVAVFSFDSVNIPASVLLEVEGSRPFKLVAAGELALGGVILASGFDAEDFEAGPFPGGPGGGAGGIDGTDPGDGPGGGGVSPSNFNGGGGGGFGGAGGRGGVDEGDLDPPGLGGPAYGNLNVTLQGGSGGGGGSDTGGGGGGGAVALYGSIVRILPGAEVLADGGSGAVGGNGASGGGSGGGILVHGENVVMDGLLSAVGGDGGEGGCCGDGGGGGGGRIAIQYRTLSMAGVNDVAGGISDLGGGVPSIEPTGAPGVVTVIAAATAATSPATAVGSTSAVLNGLINPNSSATSYRFEYGTTPAYGSLTAVAPVGADGITRPVAQTIAGLEPNTTYHFRVVAIDGVGFVTRGANASFKTPACIVPKLKGKKVKAARKALRKANCKVGKVKRSFSAKVNKGRVIKQRTKAGKVLPAGAKVAIKVSKGEKQAPKGKKKARN
jgi:hypothetical protein